MSQTKGENDFSPYCPVCSGCGEEGCCTPLKCTQSPDGSYCESYLQDLKFGYAMYESVMSLIEAQQEKHKELLDSINTKFEENYDIFYGKGANQPENAPENSND